MGIALMALGADGPALRLPRADARRRAGPMVHGEEIVEAWYWPRLFRSRGVCRVRPLFQLEDDQRILRRLSRVPDLRLRHGQGRFRSWAQNQCSAPGDLGPGAIPRV